MKSFFLLFTIWAAGFTATAQTDKKNDPPKRIDEARLYWVAILLKGPQRDQDSTALSNIQKGHVRFIDSLYLNGKIKVAGPFDDKSNWEEMFILDAATKEEAEKILQQDPAIKAKRLVYEVHPWYTMPTGSFRPGKPRG